MEQLSDDSHLQCRLCSARAGLISLFRGKSRKNRDYIRKLASVTIGIQYEENDYFHFICSSCVIQLYNIYVFKIKSLENQEKLKGLFRKSSTHQNNKVKKLSDIHLPVCAELKTVISNWLISKLCVNIESKTSDRSVFIQSLETAPEILSKNKSIQTDQPQISSVSIQTILNPLKFDSHNENNGTKQLSRQCEIIKSKNVPDDGSTQTSLRFGNNHYDSDEKNKSGTSMRSGLADSLKIFVKEGISSKNDISKWNLKNIDDTILGEDDEISSELPIEKNKECQSRETLAKLTANSLVEESLMIRKESRARGCSQTEELLNRTVKSERTHSRKFSLGNNILQPVKRLSLGNDILQPIQKPSCNGILQLVKKLSARIDEEATKSLENVKGSQNEIKSSGNDVNDTLLDQNIPKMNEKIDSMEVRKSFKNEVKDELDPVQDNNRNGNEGQLVQVDESLKVPLTIECRRSDTLPTEIKMEVISPRELSSADVSFVLKSSPNFLDDSSPDSILPCSSGLLDVTGKVEYLKSCRECAKLIYTRAEMLEHKKNHMICPLCKKKFCSIKKTKEHKKNCSMKRICADVLHVSLVRLEDSESQYSNGIHHLTSTSPKKKRKS